jgi:cytochrome oxidase Cu insertion factor (SCO1/SenC/PrrC family)
MYQQPKGNEMSQFKVGDKVRVVSITDIDAELDDPKRVMRTNEELSENGFDNVPGPAIGDIGVVTELYFDYYDLSIKLDHDADNNDEYAMVDADLELLN